MRILDTIKVYLVQRPQLVHDGVDQFLKDSGLRWPTSTEGVVDAERAIELAGRLCFVSFGSKAGSKTNEAYINNLLGRLSDDSFRPGPSHGSVVEHEQYSFIVSGASRGFCFDDETKVLTERGWIYFKEWQGEKVLTKDFKDNLYYVEPLKFIEEDWDGDLLHFKNTQLNLMVTPNHKMWVYDYDKRSKYTRIWKFLDAAFLTNNRYIFDRGGNWEGREETKITISAAPLFDHRDYAGSRESKDYDAGNLMELVGWWITDGGMEPPREGTGRKLKIYQKKKTGRDRIRVLLNELKIPYRETDTEFLLNDVALWFYFKDLFFPGDVITSYDKSLTVRIPRSFFDLSSPLLERLLEGITGGDGFADDERNLVYTSSPGFCEDLVELSLKLGSAGSIRKYREAGHKRYWPDGHVSVCEDSYVVNTGRDRRVMLNRKSTGVKLGERTPYRGKVYCFELPQHHLLMVMREGKPCWSGNSHEQVRHRVGFAYSQLSTRYVDFENEETPDGEWTPAYCIPPLGLFSQETRDAFVNSFVASQKSYVECLHLVERDLKSNSEFMKSLSQLSDKDAKRALRKAARGAAREVLPNATEALIFISANSRALWNTIYLRASVEAEAVIRQVYVQICRIMEKESPHLFKGIKYTKVWDGSEAVILPREKL